MISSSPVLLFRDYEYYHTTTFSNKVIKDIKVLAMKETIPVFVVNLKKDTEKKQHMKALCEKHNLQCQFTEAVYGKDLDENFLSEIYNEEESIRTLGRALSKSEIGCALSHINIYKHMIDENIEQAVIFEDDSQIEEGFSSVLENINRFPKDWELVLLGYYSDPITEKCSRSSLRYRKKVTGLHQTVRPIEHAYGTHGYLINQKGAKKLLKKLSVIKKPIDHYTSDDNNLNLYAVYPRIIQLHETFKQHSNIIDERQQMIDDRKIYKNKQNGIYKIKRELLRLIKPLLKYCYAPIKKLKPYT